MPEPERCRFFNRAAVHSRRELVNTGPRGQCALYDGFRVCEMALDGLNPESEVCPNAMAAGVKAPRIALYSLRELKL